MIEFRRLAIPDLIEIVPVRLQDHRGFFSETWRQSDFRARGLAFEWVQENQSLSVARGTVRGLHFQRPPVAQAKLIRVLCGASFDVAVDLRVGSPSYGRWLGLTLTSDLGNQMLIPEGFAHGFMTLVDHTEIAYKASAPYSPCNEGVLCWDDTALGIEWPQIGATPILSEKDASAGGFTEFASPFSY